MAAADTLARILTEDVRTRLFRPTGEAVGLPGKAYPIRRSSKRSAT